MRSHTLPTTSILVLVLALALGGSSCSAGTDANGAGTPGEESTTSAFANDSTSDPDPGSAVGQPSDAVSDEAPTDWVEPLDAAVEKIVGYSQNAVVTAVNDARFDSMVTCMTAQGWEFDLSDLPPAATTEEEQQTRTVGGSQSDYYLSIIDSFAPGGEPEPGTETPPDDPQTSSEISEDTSDCWQQAEVEFPNPIDSLWSWMATELEDLNHKVGQDDRYVSAQADANVCIAAEGYDFRTSGEGYNHFFDMAYAVWTQYKNGDIDKEVARAELQDLSAETSEFTETDFACHQEFGRIAHQVRAEYEEQFLAEHGDQVALAAQEYKENLEPLREFLLARKED